MATCGAEACSAAVEPGRRSQFHVPGRRSARRWHADTGTPVIPIALLGLSAGNQTNFRVTVNSSAPLINGVGDSLPFSEIAWVTRDGDIPAGQFDESANQFLMNYTFAPTNRGRGVIDYLTFSYTNTRIYPAGTYTGRVTYTVTEL